MAVAGKQKIKEVTNQEEKQEKTALLGQLTVIKNELGEQEQIKSKIEDLKPILLEHETKVSDLKKEAEYVDQLTEDSRHELYLLENKIKEAVETHRKQVLDTELVVSTQDNIVKKLVQDETDARNNLNSLTEAGRVETERQNTELGNYTKEKEGLLRDIDGLEIRKGILVTKVGEAEENLRKAKQDLADEIKKVNTKSLELNNLIGQEKVVNKKYDLLIQIAEDKIKDAEDYKKKLEEDDIVTKEALEKQRLAQEEHETDLKWREENLDTKRRELNRAKEEVEKKLGKKLNITI